jgi:hypothetical protein
MGPDELERRLRERLDALGPAPRAELLHVLMLPDLERADRIGEFWGYPESRVFAELLIDREEDRTLRAVLVGMLRETDLSGRYSSITDRDSGGGDSPFRTSLNARDGTRSRERQKDRFHSPERQDQVGLPSTEVRCRDEDIPSGPDSHNEPKRQEHAARGTRPVALQERDPDHCHHGASPIPEQVDDQESHRESLREDERPQIAFPENWQEGNRQSDHDGCDREAEGRTADVGGQRRVHPCGC